MPQDEALRICAAARELGLATSSTAPGSGTRASPAACRCDELAAPFDLVAVAFSKGLGAPGGSLLAGTKATIAVADRHRRRMGGAMRQNGIFSAAALYAIDHHLARLAEDHANARLLAERLAEAGSVRLDLATVQTNIVVFHLPDALAIDAPTLSAQGARTRRRWSTPSARVPCAPSPTST